MKDNNLHNKVCSFADRIIKLSSVLKNRKLDDPIRYQIVKSGTSIGANVTEANYAQSKLDFISKLGIALKESVETKFWLERMANGKFLSEKEFESLENDLEEIIKILVTVIKKSKSNR